MRKKISLPWIVAFILVIVAIFLLGITKWVEAGKVVHKEELFRHPAVYVQEIYQVDKNETLDTITDKYMKKNTYGKREHKEFRQGIIELNQWLLDRNVKPLALAMGI